VYHTAGFLWQGRFKLQPVQKEQYLITCGRYIERNPVKAEMVDEAQNYPYSSASRYCCGTADIITTESPGYAGFGTDIDQRQAAYREFLKSFDRDQDTMFDNMEMPLGNIEFIKRLTKQNGRYFPKRRGRPKEVGIVL
jgi:putative transposase